MIKEKKLNSVQPKQTRDINDGQTLLWTIRLEYNIFFSYYYNSAIIIFLFKNHCFYILLLIYNKNINNINKIKLFKIFNLIIYLFIIN